MEIEELTVKILYIWSRTKKTKKYMDLVVYKHMHQIGVEQKACALP